MATKITRSKSNRSAFIGANLGVTVLVFYLSFFYGLIDAETFGGWLPLFLIWMFFVSCAAMYLGIYLGFAPRYFKFLEKHGVLTDFQISRCYKWVPELED